MPHAFNEDRLLLSECFTGDQKASETLVRRFSDLVYRSVQYTLIAKHVPFNQHDLEDLHNALFLGLFEQKCKKLRQYQGKNGCSLSSWIRMIAVRTALDHIRKKGVDSLAWQKKRIPLEELPELRVEEPEIWANLDKAEQERLLQIGMQKLPPRDRLFIKLHFDQELCISEVAEIMKLSMANAYTVKHRAIHKLKSYVASATNSQL